MSIWDICIKRPIFTCMLVAVPIVLGLASYSRLGVDLFPNVEFPVVVVTTTLKGASVEEMETGVTKPMEEVINTISGIDELSSTTKEGVTQILVQFLLEKNRDVAIQEVRDKLSTISKTLPEGTDPPIIDKFQMDAVPVMTIVVSGRRDMREITEIARKQIKEDLESSYGVGAVFLVGGRPRAIQISVDTDLLASYGLSVEDVRQGLLRQNLELPGGRVDQGPQELVLRTMGRVEDASRFADIIIANQNQHPVRVRDVARVEDTFEEPRGLNRLDGNPAVTLVVQKQSGANTVQVVDGVKARLKDLQPYLPAGIETLVVRDQSQFIKNSISEVKFHLLLAAGLVSLTILFFIRDWRTTIIATLAIPTSIIGTFTLMDAMGFSLNNITMLALILAVGIVIDDAVVVHENIFRHMEEYGRSAREAAAAATREIALAVVATTLSLLVIFVPVAFMSGRVGRFFSSFGFTVGFAVLMSMGISFTMTPMLCARFLVLHAGHKGSKAGIIWRVIETSYGATLAWSLRHRWAVVLATGALLASIPVLFGIVGKDFVPRDDTSDFEIAIQLPEGYSLDRADHLFQELESRVRQFRGITNLLTTIGESGGRTARGQGDVTTGSIYVKMVDLRARDYSQFSVMREVREMFRNYPDLRVAVQDANLFGNYGGRNAMLELSLRGPDLEQLEAYSKDIMTWMRQQGHYVDVDTNLSLRKPELRVWIDREKASDLGISVHTVAATLNVLVGGEPVTKYKERDEQYDVWLRADLPNRDNPESIAALTIPSPRAGLVQLANLARLEQARGPGTIQRYARQRQVQILTNLEGMPVGDGVTEITHYVQSLNLPSDYRWEFLGSAKMLAESNLNFAIVFGLSFLFMYMILAAQFESFTHPITILLALPLTLPFAILSLLLLRTPMDIYAMFGLFMLFGIVKKNGILQVDYTNVLRQRGMARDPAILEANHTRLRPILMTTLMLVAAMVPIAFGQGPGAAARASMAKVILGGQLLSLLLTLLVTPVAYSLWDDLGQLWSRLRRPRRPGIPAPIEQPSAPAAV